MERKRSFDTWVERPLAEHWLGRFGEGLLAPWDGVRMMRVHPSLWKHALWPVLLNVVIWLVILVGLVWVGSQLLSALQPWVAEQLSNWSWLSAISRFIVFATVVLLCGVLAVLAWFLLTAILCSYFYGRLAEHVERLLGDTAGHQPLSMLQEVKDTTFNLLILAVGQAVIFCFNFLPLIGSVLAFVLGGGFTWYLLGADFFAYPLALRGVRRWQQLKFANDHKAHTLGLGAAVFFCGVVPLLGAVLMTTTVAGTVVLYRRIARYDAAT
ncbi:MAG: EI24 domain-containing protein [Planctomycetota bacterium]|nr:EI24 domain-containing protein [Planctomycetota bacterium]